MTKVWWSLGLLAGVFFMARAVAWPFSVDPGDPSSYAGDWGGPTLAGAAAVHCGPGVLAAILFATAIVRGRRRARRQAGTTDA